MLFIARLNCRARSGSVQKGNGFCTLPKTTGTYDTTISVLFALRILRLTQTRLSAHRHSWDPVDLVQGDDSPVLPLAHVPHPTPRRPAGDGEEPFNVGACQANGFDGTSRWITDRTKSGIE